MPENNGWREVNVEVDGKIAATEVVCEVATHDQVRESLHCLMRLAQPAVARSHYTPGQNSPVTYRPRRPRC